jgi:hypothetical protein
LTRAVHRCLQYGDQDHRADRRNHRQPHPAPNDFQNASFLPDGKRCHVDPAYELGCAALTKFEGMKMNKPTLNAINARKSELRGILLRGASSNADIAAARKELKTLANASK